MRDNFMYYLAKNLKQQHPNLFAEVPQGRSEVHTLRKWLENVLSEILNSTETQVAEKIRQADDAMILVINEIIR